MMTIRGVVAAAVMLAMMATLAPLVSAGSGGCYSYYDHAAHYKLDPLASGYPWDEVDSAMKQNPELSEVLAKGTRVPTSRPPDQHYYQPQSVVCPSDRIMLKAFTVDNKHCYVIKPEIQQLRYTRCSDKYNRDCHYCNYNKGGISKCEEDYEWMTVWAYCKSIPKPQPYPQPYPNPYPKPYPVPYPKPTVVYPRTQPRHYPGQGKAYPPAKLYAKHYYDPWAYKRWKRSPSHASKVEQISLYLPFQCSCKSFRC